MSRETTFYCVTGDGSKIIVYEPTAEDENEAALGGVAICAEELGGMGRVSLSPKDARAFIAELERCVVALEELTAPVSS